MVQWCQEQMARVKNLFKNIQTVVTAQRPVVSQLWLSPCLFCRASRRSLSRWRQWIFVLSLHSKVHEHSKEKRSSQRHYTCLAPFPAIAHTWACVPTSVLKYSTRAFQLYRPRCKKGPNHKTRVFTSSLNLTLLWLSGQEAVGKLGWKGRGQCGGGIRDNKCRKHKESCNCQPFVTWGQRSIHHVSRPCNTRSTEKTRVGSNVWS